MSFQESDANYFDFESINKCLNGSKEEPKEKTIYFMGVDPNFGGDDYCVASVLKYCDEKGFLLIDWYRKRKTTSEYNLFHIGELIKKFPNPIVTVETNSGGKIYYEQLTKNYAGTAYIIASRTSEDSKVVFLERFKLVMEKGKFHCPKDCPLTEELLLFRRKGKKLEAAQGGHDDFVISVGLALIGAVEKGFL